jgi:hypothetical protein
MVASVDDWDASSFEKRQYVDDAIDQSLMPMMIGHATFLPPLSPKNRSENISSRWWV